MFLVVSYGTSIADFIDDKGKSNWWLQMRPVSDDAGFLNMFSKSKKLPCLIKHIIRIFVILQPVIVQIFIHWKLIFQPHLWWLEFDAVKLKLLRQFIPLLDTLRPSASTSSVSLHHYASLCTKSLPISLTCLPAFLPPSQHLSLHRPA
jgi:hypothetical protein